MRRFKFVLMLAAAASIVGFSARPAAASQTDEKSATALTGPGLGGGYFTDGPGLGGGYFAGPGLGGGYFTDGPGNGGGYFAGPGLGGGY